MCVLGAHNGKPNDCLWAYGIPIHLLTKVSHNMINIIDEEGKCMLRTANALANAISDTVLWCYSSNAMCCEDED